MNLPDDKPVRYLTALELYNINQDVTGHEPFVRDFHLLKSAAKRPGITVFGQAQFPTLVEKAAALLESLAYHHLFVDGNKRTAVRAVERFLELNGYKVEWHFDEEYSFVLEVAQGLQPVEQIAAWLANHIHAMDE